MTFLARLLGSFGTGGIWVYLAIVVAVFGAGSAAGYKGKALLDEPTIANLRTDVVIEQGRTKDTINKLLEQQSQALKDVASANASALAQNQAQAATIAALSTKAAQAEAARQQASTKLLDTLRDIPHDQQTSLPASSRAYLRGVQLDQAVAARAAAADHSGQDRVPLSGGPSGTPPILSP